MRKLTCALSLLCVLMLAACGGGSSLGDGGGDGSGLGGSTTAGSTTGGSTTGGSTGSGIVSDVQLSAAQQQIIADGTSATVLTATLDDTEGEPISGKILSFSTNAGALSANPASIAFASTASITTDSSGKANVYLRSTARVGTATVIVREPVTGISGAASVEFTAAAASQITLSAAPVTVAPGGTSSIGVQVSDAGGNPVSGIAVTLAASVNQSGGAFTPSLITTDTNGRALADYQAGPTAGTDTLQASLAGGQSASAALVVASGSAQIDSVALTLGAPSAVANGVAQTAAATKVLDTAGNPLANVAVSFSTSVGQLKSGNVIAATVSAMTNAEGIATAQQISPTQVGSASITAASGGFSDSKSLNFVAGAPSSVLLTVSPTRLVPGGTASVRAVVLDTNSNRVPNVAVTFKSTTAVQAGGAQFASGTVTTDANGEAATQYIAPSSGFASDSLVAATAGGQASPAVAVSIAATNATVTGISVIADGSQIGAGQSTTLRATVQTSAGAIAGIPVSFSAPGATLNPATGNATTDATGNASLTMTAPGTLGAISVTASAGGFSAQTSVGVIAGAPTHLAVTVASSPVVPGGAASITAQVLDASNNPVAAGQQVNFRITTGNSSKSTLSVASATTDANGNVTATFVAGTAVTTGSEVVQITSGNASTVVTVSIDPSAKSVGSIVIAPANTSMTASSGTTQSAQTVVATVKDASGNALAGQSVTFSATAGSFPTSTGTTDAGGRATASYVAPLNSGSVTLTAVSGGFSNSAIVTIGAGAAASVTVSAAPSTVAPNRTSSITAIVKDASGNGVPNHAVQLSAMIGSLSASSVTTDASGAATVNFTAPVSGTATITALANPENKSGTVTVSVDGAAVAVGNLTLSALSTSIPADGASQATIRASVTGSDGSVLAGQTVGFSASAGTPTVSNVVTDANGNANFVLTAGTVPGTATVKADIGGFTKTVTVALTAGSAKTVNLSLSPATVTGGGGTTVTAVVLDASSNPVSGTTVNFSVTTNSSNGTLAAASAVTNASGVASTTYTAGIVSTTQNDTIKAVVAGATGGTNSVVLVVTNPAKTISLIASSPQLLSSASTAAQGVTLTATVKDQNNNVLPGATVQFASQRNSTSSCGTAGALQVISATTGATGSASAVLFTGGDPINQIIDVTATTSGISSSLSVPETGTLLSISGPSAIGLNATQSYTIILKDAGNNPIAGQTLSVSSSLNNTISAHAGGSFTTDSNGQVVIDYRGGTGGSDTLTVKPSICATYATQASQALQVATQTLSIVAPADNAQIPFSAAPVLSLGAEIAAAGNGYAVGDVLTVAGGTFTRAAQLRVGQIGAGGVITGFTVVDAGAYSVLPASPASTVGGNGAAATITIWQNVTVRLVGGTLAGQTISFSSTRGVFSPSSSAVTDATGVAQVALNQNSAAGNAGGGVITATCATCSPTIAASSSVQFNATTPNTVSLLATPNTVAANGTSVVTATVRDANNNPVANQPVNFTLTDDSGGSLLQSSAVSDAGGKATINYQGGNTTSSRDGVIVKGSVGGITGSTSLTVGGQSLRIVLGTGNTIAEPNSTQYQLPYSVLVTDSAGNPPPSGSVVNLNINALSYQKGVEVFTTVWSPNYKINCGSGDPGCTTTSSFGCFNEDGNLNGILDASLNEDYNHNSALDPGNPASVPVSVSLDANGSGQFSITYPQDRANWVKVRLSASIIVNGNQGTTSADFVLPGLSSDFSDQTVSPPGATSPYGTSASCSDPS